jgi:hypothetical protein
MRARSGQVFVPNFRTAEEGAVDHGPRVEQVRVVLRTPPGVEDRAGSFDLDEHRRRPRASPSGSGQPGVQRSRPGQQGIYPDPLRERCTPSRSSARPREPRRFRSRQAGLRPERPRGELACSNTAAPMSVHAPHGATAHATIAATIPAHPTAPTASVGSPRGGPTTALSAAGRCAGHG